MKTRSIVRPGASKPDIVFAICSKVKSHQLLLPLFLPIMSLFTIVIECNMSRWAGTAADGPREQDAFHSRGGFIYMLVHLHTFIQQSI